MSKLVFCNSITLSWFGSSVTILIIYFNSSYKSKFESFIAIQLICCDLSHSFAIKVIRHDSTNLLQFNSYVLIWLIYWNLSHPSQFNSVFAIWVIHHNSTHSLQLVINWIVVKRYHGLQQKVDSLCVASNNKLAKDHQYYDHGSLMHANVPKWIVPFNLYVQINRCFSNGSMTLRHEKSMSHHAVIACAIPPTTPTN